LVWIVAVIGAIAAVTVVAGVVEHFHPGWGWDGLKLWSIVTPPFYWWAAYHVIFQRYGEDRMEATFRHQAEREPVWRRWLFAFFLPVVAVGYLAIGAVDLGAELRAMRHEGPAGTFIVWSVDCGRWSCTYDGHFASDNGEVVRDDVRFLDGVPRGTTVGTRLRARDTRHRLGVFAESGIDLDWFLLPAAGGAYLLGWATWLLVRRRGRRAVDLP
jgi:hypothetical protein